MPENDILKHYGVPGMKWGVRTNGLRSAPTDVEVKTRPGKPIKTTGGKNQPPHEDAVKVATAKQKVNASGVQALSTKELQELVTRMNLEQQLSRLTPEELSAGKLFVDKLFSGVIPTVAVEGAKVALKGNEDPRVKLGLTVAETVIKSKKQGKKKK